MSGRVSGIGRTAGGILALLVLAGCAPGAAPASSPAGGGVPAEEVRVVLGLYSGRPDPEWTLTDVQVAALDAILAGLPDADSGPPEGGLGYRGFTIIRSGQTFIAYLGVIARSGDGPRIAKSDPGRLAERLLLATGRAHLADAEIAELERVLAGLP